MTETTPGACQVRCASEQPRPDELRHGAQLMRSVVDLIRSHGGAAVLVPGVALTGAWATGEEPADAVARAALAIIKAHAGRHRGVSIGIGIATNESAPASAAAVALRLASLARPDAVLVCGTTYERTRERFDYRGVGPVVPRSDPLPGPVFELLGTKPERSGTHRTGPDPAPLLRRKDVLQGLDECRNRAGQGAASVVHLIGEPGLGKSKLLRESAWLRGSAGWSGGQTAKSIPVP